MPDRLWILEFVEGAIGFAAVARRLVGERRQGLDQLPSEVIAQGIADLVDMRLELFGQRAAA